MSVRPIMHSMQCLCILLLFMFPFAASAATPLAFPGFTSTPLPGGGQSFSLPLETLLIFAALTFLPTALLMMTSFTRIVIVLSFLRQALGTQSAPPNQALIGLAFFLTLFIMGPIFEQVYQNAIQPYSDSKISFTDAVEKGSGPIKDFMLRQTRQSDLALFVKLSKSPPLQGPENVDFRILMPAFLTSELKTAFQIGFSIYIPFLIIDLVVATLLMSMGMMMMSPSIVALPFKLMLFVLVDGWQLVVGSLAQSFY